MEHILDKIAAISGSFDTPPKCVPTSAEPDGPLCGNGDIGLTGACRPEAGALDFYLSKNDLWYSDLHADRVQGDRPGMRCFGFFSFGSDQLKDGNYRAEQKIIDATIESVLYKEAAGLSVDCCVFRKTNLVVFRLRTLSESLPVWVRFTPSARDGDNVSYAQRIDGNQMTIFKGYNAEGLEWPLEAQAVATVWEKEQFKFELQAGETVLMTMPFYTNQDSVDFKTLCGQSVTPEELAPLEAAHKQWWEEFWQKSGVSLPGEPEIERYWYGSHYLMACCCEKGKFAPGIFGNWVTNDSPNWGGDYHMNYNYQAPWWGCFSSNHPELSEPYDQPLLDYLPIAIKAAKDKLGCRGAYLQVGIGPKGLKTANIHTPDGNDDPNYWGQKSNSVYAAVNMFMRFYTTCDEAYIRDTAMPYLEAVADFWEDYLKLENGRYVIYNDCIHENGAAAKGACDWVSDDTPDYSDDFNPILSLGLLRQFFQGMLDISECLKVHEERREKWLDILARLSEFPLQQRNGKTVFRYTESGMDWCDGNTLGIQHIYPAGAIGLSSSPELLKISTDTLEEMARWEDYNGFPTFYTAAARIGYDPHVILEKMNAEIKKHGYNNLFMYYGGGGIECCSAIPSCINEMLLQSHEGILRVFPVWDKDAAFQDLRTYGAFLVSGTLNGGRIGPITLMSEKGSACTILSPWADGMQVLTEDGVPVGTSKSSTQEGTLYTFETTPGMTYRILTVE